MAHQSDFQRSFSGSETELVPTAVYGLRGFDVVPPNTATYGRLRDSQRFARVYSGDLYGQFSSEPWTPGENIAHCLVDTARVQHFTSVEIKNLRPCDACLVNLWFDDARMTAVPVVEYLDRLKAEIERDESAAIAPYAADIPNIELAQLTPLCGTGYFTELLSKVLINLEIEVLRHIGSASSDHGKLYVAYNNDWISGFAGSDSVRVMLIRSHVFAEDAHRRPRPLADVSPECTCGFYAYTQPPVDLEQSLHLPMFAVVRGTGAATVGPLGFRVQRAEILVIFPSPTQVDLALNSPVRRATVERAAERYGVPTFYFWRDAVRYVMSEYPDSSEQLEPLLRRTPEQADEIGE